MLFIIISIVHIHILSYILYSFVQLFNVKFMQSHLLTTYFYVYFIFANSQANTCKLIEARSGKTGLNAHADLGRHFSHMH